MLYPKYSIEKTLSLFFYYLSWHSTWKSVIRIIEFQNAKKAWTFFVANVRNQAQGRDIHIECSKQFKWNLHFYVSGQSQLFWAVLKLLKNSNMKFKLANTYTIQCMGQAISLKSERNNPWFKPWFNILLHTQSIVCATV